MGGDRECRSPEAGVSLSVCFKNRQSLEGLECWQAKRAGGSIKEGFVGWHQGSGLYFTYNTQPFGQSLSRVEPWSGTKFKKIFWITLGQLGFLTFQGPPAWEASQLLSKVCLSAKYNYFLELPGAGLPYTLGGPELSSRNIGVFASPNVTTITTSLLCMTLIFVITDSKAPTPRPSQSNSTPPPKATEIDP